MHAENLFAALDVRAGHDNAAVEASRAKQRGIEHIGPVGRGDQDNALIRFEAVHLDQQSIKRLLALVVAAAQSCAAVASDSVNFVDEDDTGRVLLALLKQVPNAACANPHKHLNEVGPGNRKERNVGLARDGARQ